MRVSATPELTPVGMLPGAAVHRCATHCEGRTVKVITGDEDVDYSDESGGVCAIADTTATHAAALITVLAMPCTVSHHARRW